jgi:hypothetical protein
MIDETIYCVFEKYFNKIELKSECSQIFLNFLCEKVNRNIYIIDSSTKEINYDFKYQNKYKKSIVLLRFDNSNFEIIGKLLKNKKIDRQFDNDCEMIENIWKKIEENLSDSEIEESERSQKSSRSSKDVQIMSDVESPPIRKPRVERK